MSARGCALSALQLVLSYERGGAHHERLEPAEPGRDVRLWMELVRLRLADRPLQGPVSALRLEAETTKMQGDQLSLFDFAEAYRQGRPRRDPQAAERAIARVRAAYGTGAVQTFVLREGHLPEAQFMQVPQQAGSYAANFHAPHSPPSAGAPQNVRRLFSTPKSLTPMGGPRQFRVGGERVVRLLGPYRISGGWWNRYLERDYYYGQTEAGVLLWLYEDRVRNAWFWHGLVD